MMKTTNRLILSGTIYKTFICKISPSGIPHRQFLLEHRSVQEEAGFPRLAWCKLLVVVSGKQNINMINSITAGMQITVHGFISCRQGRDGLSKIVLHTEQIDLTNSGD